MNWVDPYIFLLMVIAITISFIAVALLQPPRKVVRNFLALAVGMTSIFIVLTVFELISDDRSTMIVLRNLQQIPLIFTPLLLFGYAKELYREDGWKTVRLLGILAIPSILDTTLVLTDSFHGWMRTDISVEQIWNYTEVSTQSTALSSFLGSYSFVITLATVFLLLRNMFDVPKQYRFTHGMSALVITLPLFAITIAPLLSLEIPGLFAFSYGSMGLMLIIANKRKDFNTVWPVSRHAVIENLSEGIMLLDDSGGIVELNQSLCSMVGRLHRKECNKNDILASSVSAVFPFIEELQEAVAHYEDAELSYYQDGMYFDITVTGLKEKHQRLQVIVMKDVTEKKKIEKELEMLANYDQLTGLMNRKAFLKAYEEKVEEEKIFLLMDIDYFKRFNDSYGHVIGDAVLHYMGGMMETHFTDKGDIVARLGGEEFGILTEASLQETKERVDWFRESLRRKSGAVDPVVDEDITVSVGVYVSRGNESFEYVYNKADQAMYEAKHGGRDQVRVFELV
ncbi:diguanylate cyclase [Salimicrobium sp. PL1-032A]|uniref:histidine kinase N-terminal 7TM domain-containing diguanylate cyclase n=1 Tax=Salimicrobium sp. PL1-032A TaxID=3095364 RepID=UPI00326077BB